MRHHTQFIDDCIQSGRLTLDPGQKQRVVYHDACYVGRHNREYDAPRRALAGAGSELAEVEQSRRNGFCCGAGGGRMWMEEDPATRINSERWRQLQAAAPRMVAVSCPFCMTMLSDAARAADSSVEVRDVAEIVSASLAPADGEGAASR